METIISSLIAAAVTLIVCVVNNRAEAAKSRALIEYRMLELEKKVDKHNNLIERTFSLEQDAAVIKEQIKIANHRIDDLEHQSA